MSVWACVSVCVCVVGWQEGSGWWWAFDTWHHFLKAQRVGCSCGWMCGTKTVCVCDWVWVWDCQKEGIFKDSHRNVSVCSGYVTMSVQVYILKPLMCVCVSVWTLTCHFQPTLRGVRNGGCDSHRRVSSFFQHITLTEGLGFLQFPLPSFQPLPLRPCLFPFVGRLRLETSCVVDAAALTLAAGFGIVSVPGQTALHQRSLLGICAHLERKSHMQA